MFRLGVTVFHVLKVCGHDPRRALLGDGPPEGCGYPHVGVAKQVERPGRLRVGVLKVRNYAPSFEHGEIKLRRAGVRS